jgi:hypothetical protein
LVIHSSCNNPHALTHLIRLVFLIHLFCSTLFSRTCRLSFVRAESWALLQLRRQQAGHRLQQVAQQVAVRLPEALQGPSLRAWMSRSSGDDSFGCGAVVSDLTGAVNERLTTTTTSHILYFLSFLYLVQSSERIDLKIQRLTYERLSSEELRYHRRAMSLFCLSDSERY